MSPAAPNDQSNEQEGPSASTSHRTGSLTAKALGLAADGWRVFLLGRTGGVP